MGKATRQLLHEVLVSFQESVGETPHVYFQPPESVKITYPCFIYHQAASPTISANDQPYLYRDVYEVKYITREAEPKLPELMQNLKNVSYDRRYSAENLNHFVFTFSSMLMYAPSDQTLSVLGKDFLGGN